jgi:glycosyltransferase involved in cell wall biosynthesis
MTSSAPTLLLTVYTPRLDTGHGVRTYGVVAALARWGEVEVAYRPLDGPIPSPAYAALPGVALTRLADTRGPRRAAAYLRSRLAGMPADLARGVTAELVAAARRAPAGTRVVADGPIVAGALLGLARRRPVVYCAHNLESAFRHTIPGSHEDREALERFERRLLAAAAETWMVSAADVEGGLRLCPSARMRLVPNVVDAGAIAPVAPLPGSRRVLFVADLHYGPNRAGLEFLRDDVRPLLLARVPDAEIVVVGRGAREDDGAPGLAMRGRVEDLQAEYAAAAAVAVPLLQGGGSPLKFVEALAYGLPVVATPKAAAGLEARAGEHYLEAAGAEAFAEGLSAALTRDDDVAAMAARGRALVLERYSIEALAELLRDA